MYQLLYFLCMFDNTQKGTMGAPPPNWRRGLGADGRLRVWGSPAVLEEGRGTPACCGVVFAPAVR